MCAHMYVCLGLYDIVHEILIFKIGNIQHWESHVGPVANVLLLNHVIKL